MTGEKRIMNAYIALMGVLLVLLLGILCYTGYEAYVGTESAVEVVK